MEQPGLPLADSDVTALMRLQRIAYLVEAELIGDDRIPVLRETEAELRTADLLWIFDRDDNGTIRGALGFRADHGEVVIHRLIVDPECHRRGIGTELVRKVLTIALRTTVSTGRQNQGARALYEGLGFTHIDDSEAIPGLWVSNYEWIHSGTTQ
ncbi:GNAT family N-acetyltransferase [Leucobacter alluvii]|uniref:GNAT family N-acetyltransferase n=1 Tax=Leucobacter alluvii TaxID=340321 RepID=A0ABN3B4S5_9MICO